MFSIILVIFSTTETKNDSFLPPGAFFTLSFISFTDTITKFPPKNAYNSPVSINTPTKGVTLIFSSICMRSEFQSTHPRRVWLGQTLLCIQLHLFQSTHPRRVWHSVAQYRSQQLCFNPHTHEGCDRNDEPISGVHQVSIHTPTKGVTSAACLYG